MRSTFGWLFRAIIGALAILNSHCAVFPPPAMPIEGASRDPVGSTSARVYGSDAASVLKQAAGAGGARISYQLRDRIAVGLEGFGGLAPKSGYMAGGRAQMKLNLWGDYLALSVGAGGLYAHAISAAEHWGAVTLDGGLRLSTGRRFLLEPYLSVTGAGGVSVGTSERVFIGYFEPGFGLIFRPTERWSVGADLLMVPGVLVAAGDEATFDSASYVARNSLAWAPIITLHMGYRFGGTPEPAGAAR